MTESDPMAGMTQEDILDLTGRGVNAEIDAEIELREQLRSVHEQQARVLAEVVEHLERATGRVVLSAEIQDDPCDPENYVIAVTLGRTVDSDSPLD